MSYYRDALHDDLMGELLLKWVDGDVLWTEWMANLNNPIYQQGFTAMLCKGYYCPLGVLCTVAGIPPEFRNGPDRPAHFAGYGGTLPSGLAEFMHIHQFAEFKNAVPAKQFGTDREYPAGSVISLNDTAHWTFTQIAQYLSKHRDNMRAYGEY